MSNRLSTIFARVATGASTGDHYILRGDENGEEWPPRFTFHGFQYVEVTGYPGTPTKDAITGIVLHSDTPLTSDFECSDPMPNRLPRLHPWRRTTTFEKPREPLHLVATWWLGRGIVRSNR